MRKENLIIIAIIILAIGSYFYIEYSKKTCIDSNEQCEGKPDGTQCTYGIWCDNLGRICGGQSCVGLGLGQCFSGECISLPIQSESYIKCLKERDIPGEYVKGEVLIEFQPRFTEEEINNFLGELESEGEINIIEVDHIKVPEGKELEWICRLKENEIVQEAYFNMIAHAL